MSATTYPVVRNLPVAKFRYRGSHSKPVRRTVVLTRITRSQLTGYEVREGNEVRDLEEAQIKSFTRDEIQNLERQPMTTEW